MKKTLLITIGIGMLGAASAFAQGQFTFVASAASSPITSATDGVTKVKVPTGNPAQVGAFGQLNVAFLIAANGTVLGTTSSAFSTATPNFTTAWTQVSTILHTISPVAGQTGANPITLPVTGTVELEIVGWTGTATSFAAALQGNGLVGWTGSALSGGALSWSQPTGDPTATPPGLSAPLVTGAGGYAGLALAPPVPEPSTIALGGLGAAALLAFRRRK